jgi:phosphonate transport system ATP-binding protein
LALDYFPRVIGVRHGRIAFDLPAAAVTDQVLAALYVGIEASPVLSGYS